MMRRSLTLRGLIALAALVPLAACSGQVIEVGDVRVLVSEQVGSGMSAVGGGRLEVLAGCLGAGGSVIVWPHGTTVAEGYPLTITIPGNGTFSLGDEVEVTGGYVLEHSSRDVEPGEFSVAGVTVPAECATQDIFLAH